MSNLSLVVCGAPLARRAYDVAAALTDAGWSVSIIATSAAEPWLGAGVATTLRQPEQPKPARPDAIIVCPMTFNTANKWALGIADSQPLSLLAESLGAGISMVAVPFVNEFLAGHPSWSESLARLSRAGVRLVDPAPGHPGPLRSGTGEHVTARFDPSRLVAALG